MPFVKPAILILALLSNCSRAPHLTVQTGSSKEIAQEGWKQFVSPDGSFKMMFPDSPQAQEYSVESPSGKLEVHSYKYVGSSSYFISYTDYPESIDQPQTSELVLDHARDAGMRGVNGRLVSQSNIFIHGYPGRLIVVESPNGGPNGSLIKNKVYLVDRRLYSMQVAIPHSGGQSFASLEIAGDRFLDSFELGEAKKNRLSITGPSNTRLERTRR